MVIKINKYYDYVYFVFSYYSHGVPIPRRAVWTGPDETRVTCEANRLGRYSRLFIRYFCASRLQATYFLQAFRKGFKRKKCSQRGISSSSQPRQAKICRKIPRLAENIGSRQVTNDKIDENEKTFLSFSVAWKAALLRGGCVSLMLYYFFPTD